MSHTYSAIEIAQRTNPDAPRLILFAAPSGEIIEWADVARLDLQGEGHQRRRNEAKIRAITKFLAADDRNTIPSALTIALSNVSLDQSQDECITVTIPSLAEGGNGLVIDGQHRLYGAERHDAAMPLNVVAILDPSDLEVAFQFLVINNKASKVPTDHIRLLAANIDDSELTNRLRAARLSLSKTAALIYVVDLEEESPFYKSVIWPIDTDDDDQRRDLVLPAAIEIALSNIDQKDLVGLDNEDALIAFFFALWQSINDTWPDLWIEDSRLLSKAGLVAMTNFLLDDLTPFIDRDRLDASNPDEVADEVKEILRDLESGFWTEDWTRTGLDTTAGRELIVESLQRIRRNKNRGEPWYSGVSLVSTSASST